MSIHHNEGKTDAFRAWAEQRHQEALAREAREAAQEGAQPLQGPPVPNHPGVPDAAPQEVQEPPQDSVLPAYPQPEPPDEDEVPEAPPDEITECPRCCALVMESRLEKHYKYHLANDVSEMT